MSGLSLEKTFRYAILALDHSLTSAAKLLAWYDRVRRELPWRDTADPYAVWVSEVMLQQTRVETVVGHYLKFLARFPTVEALAAAESKDVLAQWSGLGYYRRARQLHLAAQEIAERGEFPRTSSELVELPGIGPYTAAAVASIAFGERLPVIDGNVERVTSRLLAYAGPTKTAAGRRRLAARAQDLLTGDRPGDGNQALMELGATVCLPREPRCEVCPLRDECSAYAAGTPEAYPRPAKKRRPTRIVRTTVAVEAGERVLLVKRGEEEAVLPGFWEFPAVAWDEDPSVERALAERYGGRWRLEESCGWVRHAITNRSFKIEVRRALLTPAPEVAENGAPAETAWLSRAETRELPTSSLVEKIFERLASRRAQIAGD